MKAVSQISLQLRSIPGLVSPLDDVTFSEYCSLLVTVSMVVLQHFGLAPHLRLLNSMDMISDNVFESRPSRDQLAILPESLTGKLSGIRFIESEAGSYTHLDVYKRQWPPREPSRCARIAIA